MISYEKALEIIEFQNEQIAALTEENTRLKNESGNCTESLIIVNERNSVLSNSVNNANESLRILGIEPWATNYAYIVGNRVSYDCGLYECVQAHTSQSDWTPDITPALWKKISLDEYPDWVQPTGAQDAYKKGDKVSHKGKHWVSDYDNNVWEPSVFGWSEIQ